MFIVYLLVMGSIFDAFLINLRQNDYLAFNGIKVYGKEDPCKGSYYQTKGVCVKG